MVGHVPSVHAKSTKELQTALCRYITDTLTYIHTVTGFCEGFPKWLLRTKTELDTLMDIKDGIDALDLKITHVYNSEEKYSRREKLEKELTEVLEYVLRGQEKLQPFLDAVEKLAVTSQQVFKENQELHLPEGIRLEHIQSVISAAQQICPLLLEFKRDSKVFFRPKLENVDVLAYQLDRYIVTSQKIHEKTHKKCNCFFHSAINDIWLKSTKAVVDLNVDLSEAGIQSMLHHIYLLKEIRMDPNFRMVFLFQEKSCSDFIKVVQNRQPDMLKFLEDLEQCAVQLDRMNKGAKISSITGSSVGAVGGVLSIVGLALSPVTAGASLGLSIGGTAMGILSGTNSAVTTFTEMRVKRREKNKANKVFQKFTKDVQNIKNCLGKVISQPTDNIEVGFYKNMCMGFGKVGSVGKKIHTLVKDASNVKLVKSKNLVTGSGKMVAQKSKALSNAPKMVPEIPEMSQKTFKGSLALSKAGRASAIALNAFFLGMDIISICQESISLGKANKTKTSKFISARASLWKSEMKSWQNIHDSLNEGLKTSDKKKAFLEMPFYPEMKRKVQKKQSVSFVEMNEKEREIMHNRKSVSFENKQRGSKLKLKREISLFIVILGLLGCAAWLCGTFTKST
uniref:Uncharacterized protein n=1 Tax=Astatotilapia calliptera TaxID=8154 RepID=A0A3P8QTQ9_ASTCA